MTCLQKSQATKPNALLVPTMHAWNHETRHVFPLYEQILVFYKIHSKLVKPNIFGQLFFLYGRFKERTWRLVLYHPLRSKKSRAMCPKVENSVGTKTSDGVFASVCSFKERDQSIQDIEYSSYVSHRCILSRGLQDLLLENRRYADKLLVPFSIQYPLREHVPRLLRRDLGSKKHRFPTKNLIIATTPFHSLCKSHRS